ncbi:hypothetical protein PHYPO_G00005190 [Pangasianodon hypophthalmus]|uniref:Uncharacterized protein n=1 Tax=Pangasianodon hypophthalmus TaxID=310915 RepID=A0A5N5Q4L0_PANHP|nr:hypothetical protein PHYPO_G00005190 [Pangasianodon hypophthalmus]
MPHTPDSLGVSLSSVRFGRQGAWLVHGPHAERREQPERALSSPLQPHSSTTSSGSVTALQLALLLPKQAVRAWISPGFVLPDMDGPPLAESEACSLVQ